MGLAYRAHRLLLVALGLLPRRGQPQGSPPCSCSCKRQVIEVGSHANYHSAVVQCENDGAPKVNVFDLLAGHVRRCMRWRSWFSCRSFAATTPGWFGSPYWESNERTALTGGRHSGWTESGGRSRLSNRYLRLRWTASCVGGNQRSGSISRQPAIRHLSRLRRFASPW